MIDRGKIKQAAAMLLLSVMVAGCKRGVPMNSEVNEIPGYSKPQSVIVLASEKKYYEDLYTDKIWETAITDQVNYDTYLKSQVMEFLIELKTINLLAQEREITLTGAEQELMRQASEEYWKGLSEKEKETLQITQEDVLTMYTEYCLANKVVEQLTSQEELEISDDEAKVIQVEQIQLKDEESAKKVYDKAIEEGADFHSIAKENSLDPEIKKAIKRGEWDTSYETAVFSLTEGEVSEILQSGNFYYVVKCLDDYDEKATLEYKSQLADERKKEAFRRVYNQFKEEHPVVMKGEFWESAGIPADIPAASVNFFEIYRSYMSE